MEDLQIAPSEKKCPLCGGDVILGECNFCGYAVPDTEKLSAVYDLSPDNVNFSEYDDGDELLSIETPDASTLPTAKQIRDAARRRRAAERRKQSQEKNAAGGNPANGAAGASPANIANNANAPFVPYTKPDYGKPPEQAHEQASEPLSMSEMMVKSVSDFVIHHWWKFLLTAILPSVGYGFAFFYFVINRDNDKERKISELFFAGVILLITILLQAAGWDPTGLDILVRAVISEYLTRGRHRRYY